MVAAHSRDLKNGNKGIAGLYNSFGGVYERFGDPDAMQLEKLIRCRPQQADNEALTWGPGAALFAEGKMQFYAQKKS